MVEHAPGWYEHDGERRYWDGRRWTHGTSALSAASMAYPPPPSDPVSPLTLPYAPPPAPFAGTPPSWPTMGPGPAVVAPRKEPWLAVLASFLLPGLGSIINGDTGVGATLMITYALSVVFLLCFWIFLIGLIGIPVMLLVWVGGMVHAHQGAVGFNLRAGYPG